MVRVHEPFRCATHVHAAACHKEDANAGLQVLFCNHACASTMQWTAVSMLVPCCAPHLFGPPSSLLLDPELLEESESESLSDPLEEPLELDPELLLDSLPVFSSSSSSSEDAAQKREEAMFSLLF